MTDQQIVTTTIELLKAHGNTGAVVLAGIYCKDVVNEIIKKLTYPTAEAAGVLLKKSFDFGTLQHPVSIECARKIGQAIHQVFNRLSTFEPNDLVEKLPPEVSVPILTKLSYFEDEDLRELLVGLLTGSMLKTGQVHPTVISIVDRLTPGEAKILKLACQSGNLGPWPAISITAALNPRQDAFKMHDLIAANINDDEALSVLAEKAFDQGKRVGSGFREIGGRHLATLGANADIGTFETISFCIANLRALGLVEVTYGFLENKSVYGKLIVDAKAIVTKAIAETDNVPIFEREKLTATPLGMEIIIR